MQLSKFQKRFKETILNPDALQSDEEFAAVLNNGRIPATDRLKVYRNNVIVSLKNAVIAVYPMIEKLVGEVFMEQMVREYIVSDLPTHGDLNGYGATFPRFIKEYKPAKNHPYLYDMARLEWAWEYAEHAPDDEALNPSDLHEIPEARLPSLSFAMRKNIVLIESGYPLDQIVDFCREDNTEDKTLDIDTGGVHLMVFRPKFKVNLRKLSPAEYIFLKRLSNGDPLLQAAEQALATNPDFDLMAVFQKHLELRTFSDFKEIK